MPSLTSNTPELPVSICPNAIPRNHQRQLSECAGDAPCWRQWQSVKPKRTICSSDGLDGQSRDAAKKRGDQDRPPPYRARRALVRIGANNIGLALQTGMFINGAYESSRRYP